MALDHAATRGLALLTGMLAACSAPLSPPGHEAPAAASAAIEGEVLGPAGEPIVAALVSVSSHFDLTTSEPGHDEMTDARGHFRFVGLPPGRYGITATCAAQAAGYGGLLTVTSSDPTAHVTLRVGGPSVAVEGTVTDERGAPVVGARVLAPALSEHENEVYVARTDARGHYSLRLGRDNGYFVVVDAAPRARVSRQIEPIAQTVDLRLAAPPAPRPADAVIAAWLRAHAVPLVEARELDEAGSRAVAAIAGDAPLVALGEATHGSAEFTRFRQRVFQSLVRDRGFTVYALEVGWADAFALDDYVVNGKGDARQALRELLTWKDETTEMLAFVEWMRAYNADPGHAAKLHIEGFDVLTPHAVPALLAYLQKVDPGMVEEARKTLAPFVGADSDGTYPALPKDERDRTRRGVEALVARLDASHAAHAARSTEDEWQRGRHLARLVQQAEISYVDTSARDGQMVENIRWLMDHHPPGTRFLLDAHSSHIAAERHGMSELGAELRASLGARYVPVGFAFGEGSFRALDWRKGPSNVLTNLDVPRAPLGTFDGDLGLVGLAAFVIDLRGSDGPVGAWLRSPQPMHSIGGHFEGPEHAFESCAPARAFDAVIYLDRVSPIHPLPPKN